MQDLLKQTHRCVLCGNSGTLANNGGIRCYGCHAFFHQLCIDPLRLSVVPSVVSGSATLWMCSDCSDILADTLDREDAGEDVDAVADKDEDDDEGEEAESEEDEAGDDQVENEDESESEECDCCKCDAKIAIRPECTCECTCADDDEFSGDDDESWIEKDEETIEKLRRGEVVWSRSECPCETCVETNRAVDEWPELVRRAATDRLSNPIARAIISAATRAEEQGLNPGLDNLLFNAGLAPMTADEVSRRGRL